MSTLVSDTLKARGDGGFPVVMAEDVQLSSTDTRSVKKAIEDINNGYATKTTAGIVKVGDHIEVKTDGTISVDENDIYLKKDVYTKDETDQTIKTIIGSFIKKEDGTTGDGTGENQKTKSNETPVGTVIAHMGNTPPEHYLICDGTVYNIADYQELADFFTKEFGSVNKFGGDGTTTFAVPNLQGEFLRGTGTNGHANCGNGASVGTHQDPTFNPRIIADGDGFEWICAKTSNDGIGDSKNIDSGKYFNTTGTGAGTLYKYTSLGSNWTGYQQNYDDHIASRPTNTSVLYCIKYESTYYMSVLHNDSYVSEYYENYSEDEVVIGKYINGKPLYRKIFTTFKYPATTNGTFKNVEYDLSSLDFDEIANMNMIWYNSPNYQKGPYTTNSGYQIKYQVNVSTKQLILVTNCGGLENMNTTFTMEYTKTTDAIDSFTSSMIYKQYSLGDLPAEATQDEVDAVFA